MADLPTTSSGGAVGGGGAVTVLGVEHRADLDDVSEARVVLLGFVDTLGGNCNRGDFSGENN